MPLFSPTRRIRAGSRNLGVKLRGSLCDVLKYVSAQPLAFLDLAKRSFMNWKPIGPVAELMDGH